MQLSIIIVNYNVKFFLEQCLCSVAKACSNIAAEIIVVDNNSTDGSKEFFSDRFPAVTFLWRNNNAGFAKANNEALKIATGDKVLFLNPDTIVPEDCFEKCLDFFAHTPGIGALGVKMIDGSGNYLPESKRSYPSAFVAFCKMSGLSKLFPSSRLFSGYYMTHVNENEVCPVDVLPGAFLMADKKMVLAIEGIDERFFMYGEDIDLSYRIQKSGLSNYYFPKVTIIHFKGESTQKASPHYIDHFYGAMILFTKKHSGKVWSTIYAMLLKIIIAFKKLFTERVAVKDFDDLKQLTAENTVIVGDLISDKIVGEKIKKHFAAIAYITDITSNDTPAKNVIFCEPFISFKNIIASVEKSAGQYRFFIHGQNTSSVVCSTDKSRRGVVITLDS